MRVCLLACFHARKHGERAALGERALVSAKEQTKVTDVAVDEDM